MLNACDLMGIPRLPCLAHLINLLIRDALESSQKVTSIILTMKNIVTYFKQNVTSLATLETQQEQNENMVIKTLLQSVITRWNSELIMIERFVELKTELYQVVPQYKKCPDMVTNSDFLIVEDMIKLLTPFKVIITYKYFHWTRL